MGFERKMGPGEMTNTMITQFKTGLQYSKIKVVVIKSQTAFGGCMIQIFLFETAM